MVLDGLGRLTAPRDAVTFSRKNFLRRCLVHTVEAGRRIALKNILFATDFSPCSNAALPYALSVARRYGATLHAAHVMPTRAEMLLMSPEDWPAGPEEEDKWIHTYVEQLEKQVHGVPHEVLTPRGKVVDALAQIIEEREIDLLVLGTHGRSGFGKLIHRFCRRGDFSARHLPGSEHRAECTLQAGRRD